MESKVGSMSLTSICAALLAGALASSVFGAEPLAVRPADLLKETFQTSVTNCGGWGKWDAPPSVTANSGAEPATFPSGIRIPARSVIVHPGTEVDAVVGWKSPVAGKVSIRAKVTHAHPAGGDGVSWKLVHVGAAGHKALAAGEIERGGMQAVMAADGWNWTREPSVFPLVGRVAIDNETKDLRWKFEDGAIDKTNGQHVVVRFICEDPALEVRSIWSAKPGRGPLRHTLQYVRRSLSPTPMRSIMSVRPSMIPPMSFLPPNWKAVWAAPTAAIGRKGRPGCGSPSVRCPWVHRSGSSIPPTAAMVARRGRTRSGRR